MVILEEKCLFGGTANNSISANVKHDKGPQLHCFFCKGTQAKYSRLGTNVT